MSLWMGLKKVGARVQNVFRSTEVNQDIDEELRSHFDEAAKEGRPADETRREFGSPLYVREATHDGMVWLWLETVVADVRFGWGQLWKQKASSFVAILSLALGIGSCVATFRLIDSIFLRPLPVSNPEQLRVIGVSYLNEFGRQEIGYSGAYEPFQVLRRAVQDQAELLAINAPYRTDITYGSDNDMEQAYRQYVSGEIFPSFGLRPVLGRLLAAHDDLVPGASPTAVLAYHYWEQRFAKDPSVIGRRLRAGKDVFEIVGVAPKGFTGTEPGVITDFFVPITMDASVGNPDVNWFRMWVRLKATANEEVVHQRLSAALTAYRAERAKSFPTGARNRGIGHYLHPKLVLESASAGVSDLQRSQRVSLIVLGTVAFFVLLIACINVACLMWARTASRAREMALRVSIGAAQGRLVRLLLVESSMLALIASVAGLAFAWWAAPTVAGMISPPSDPIRLVMPADGRLVLFGVLLTFAVALLFGLAPAWGASGVKPAFALKGGADPQSRNKRLNWTIAIQVSFCFVVCLGMGLFVSSFRRLQNQLLGFSAERVLTLDTVTASSHLPEDWYAAAEILRAVPGVESASMSAWALMSGSGMNLDVSVDSAAGERPDGEPAPWFLGVSPGWLSTMKIPLLQGRDFRIDDAFPRVAIVNRAFARRYFAGSDPVGRTFNVRLGPDRVPVQIIALTDDARYTGMREAIPATAYIPFRRLRPPGVGEPRRAALIVRTQSENMASLAPTLRQAIAKGAPGFRVSNIRTQDELVRRHTLRERLLAALSLFFAIVGLILAGLGLYGVLNHAVVQRRREFGIRLALGASPFDVVRRLIIGVLAMAGFGSAIGIGVSITSENYIRTLLYEVKSTDPFILAVPLVTILVVIVIAALPPSLRILKTDPSLLYRAE